MSTVVKKAAKYLTLFLGITLLYFGIVKINLQFSGDADILLIAEGVVFCSLLYSYLGIKYHSNVKKEMLSVSRRVSVGVAFFVIGLLMFYFPVHIVSGLCDVFGAILFGIKNESNVQIVFLWIVCSVVIALICYDAAEKKYKETNKHEKTDK